MYENRVLRKIFGPKREWVTEDWRKLHNEELNDLYSSPNILRVIKSRKMRLTGYVANMEKGRYVHKVLVGYLRERDHQGDQDLNGRIMKNWIFRKWEGVVGSGLSCVRIGALAGSCKNGNERSGFNNTGKISISCRNT